MTGLVFRIPVSCDDHESYVLYDPDTGIVHTVKCSCGVVTYGEPYDRMDD